MATGSGPIKGCYSQIHMTQAHLLRALLSPNIAMLFLPARQKNEGLSIQRCRQEARAYEHGVAHPAEALRSNK